MNKVTYTVVNYRELEEAIQKHFGRSDYNIVADEEWNNGSDRTFSLDGDVISAEKVRRFKSEGGAHRSCCTLCSIRWSSMARLIPANIW